MNTSKLFHKEFMRANPLGWLSSAIPNIFKKKTVSVFREHDTNKNTIKTESNLKSAENSDGKKCKH